MKELVVVPNGQAAQLAGFDIMTLKHKVDRSITCWWPQLGDHHLRVNAGKGYDRITYSDMTNAAVPAGQLSGLASLLRDVLRQGNIPASFIMVV